MYGVCATGFLQMRLVLSTVASTGEPIINSYSFNKLVLEGKDLVDSSCVHPFRVGTYLYENDTSLIRTQKLIN